MFDSTQEICNMGLVLGWCFISAIGVCIDGGIGSVKDRCQGINIGWYEEKLYKMKVERVIW